MSHKDIVQDIISSNELAGDVIRVLFMFNGVLWMKEIEYELFNMYSLIGGELDISNLKDTIITLKENNIVSIKEMIRASLTKSEKDYLVRLVNARAVSEVLYEDDKLRRYIKARADIYSRYKSE